MSVALAADTLFVLSARILHVRRREMARTGMVALLAIVVGWGMSNGFNVTQAVFLTRAGVGSLPVFFIYLALTVWPMLALRGMITGRYGVGRSLGRILLVNVALALLLFLAYLESETPTVALVAALACSVCFELVMLLFWEFVSEHFNLLEGKRIFPVIAAGISLGYILSGVTVALVASLWSTERLMLAWAAGAAVSALLVFRIDSYLRHTTIEHEEGEHPEEKVAPTFGRALRSFGGALATLFSSRLVAAVVISAGLMLCLLRIADYIVAIVFVQAAKGDLDELTILLGNAFAFSYAVQLVLGLFVTPYLLTRVGVKNTILVLPASALVAFALLAGHPGLVAGALMFIVRSGIGPGVDDPTQNVLASALPERLKAPLKQLLDGVVIPGAAISAGAVLLVTHQGTLAEPLRHVALGSVAGCAAVLLGTLWMRSLYVQAVYQRLRSHAISVSEFGRAVGDLSAEQVEELRGYIHQGRTNVRSLAASAIGRLAPDRFREMVAELSASPDAGLRRLALELAPAGTLVPSQLAAAAHDPDPWVAAAAVVAGSAMSPPWPGAGNLLERLLASPSEEAVAAGVWAAARAGDAERVLAAAGDQRARVRVEALRRLGGLALPAERLAAPPLACLHDRDAAVRREALRQVVHWSCPPERLDDLAAAVVESLSSSDGVTRRLAAEALAASHPDAWEGAVHLLHGHDEVAITTLESFVRSGRRHLIEVAEAHLAQLLEEGLRAAREAARYRRLARATAAASEEPQLAILRLALENFQLHVVEMCLAALRAIHRKRDFSTVERGLRSADAAARSEALETLLNLGPAWLVEPLVSLLETDSFESSTLLLSASEVHLIEQSPDAWMDAAAAGRLVSGESVKNLVALRAVPIFSRLSLPELAFVDRLMVTRRYRHGDGIFRIGDQATELYVIRDGGVRIHRDVPGQKVTLARLGPGEFLGETTLLNDERWTVAAEALTECTLRILTAERLEEVVARYPEVLLEFVRRLGGPAPAPAPSAVG